MDAGPPIIVVDLGGTNLRVGLVEPTGAIIERVREPNREEDGPERVAGRIVEAGRELLAKHGFPEAMGLGAAVASPLDKDGVLYHPPNLQSWGVVPFRETCWRSASTGRCSSATTRRWRAWASTSSGRAGG